MANVIQSSAKDPSVVLEQFIKSLDIFIKESVVNLNRMKSKHQQMASLWKGEQYNKFSAVLATSIKDAAKELAELESLRKQLLVKAAQLKKAASN